MSTRDSVPTKTLVLHVTVPGFYADDLDDYAREVADGDPTNEDRLEVVFEEWMHQEVGVSLVAHGSDCEAEELHVYKGRIVGAELRDRDARDAS